MHADLEDNVKTQKANHQQNKKYLSCVKLGHQLGTKFPSRLSEEVNSAKSMSVEFFRTVR